MRVWITANEAAGDAMAQALAATLQSLVPSLGFDCHGVAEFPWSAVAEGDGALLCVTPAAFAGEQLYFDLGRLQGAVGAAGFVAPVLLDLAPGDLAQTPLAIFQCTRTQRADMQVLVADLLRRAEPTRMLDPLDAGFADAWETLRVQLDDIPGPSLQPFLVTLALPERAVSFGFDGGTEDVTWADSVGAALRSLPSSPLKPPPFDSDVLVPLDVDARSWMELPRRLSRLRTRHLALVSPELVEQARGDARTVAHSVREEAERFGMFGGAKVMPWKFLLGHGRLMLLSNVR